MEKRDWTKTRHEIAIRKQRAAELEERGWVQASIAPYRIARVIKGSSGSIIALLADYTEKVIRAESEGYRSKNFNDLGGRTRYMSQDLFEKVQDEFKRRYTPRVTGRRWHSPEEK